MNDEEIKAIEKETGELENIVNIKWNLEQWKAVAEKGELEDYHLVEEDIEIMELAIKIIEKQKAEIEKKDKIIDLILEEIVNNHCSIRDIVEEEICDDRCIGNNNWTCFKHIKEYFENKVKESK